MHAVRDYAQKPSPDAVNVACLIHTSDLVPRSAGDLARALTAVGERYGFMTNVRQGWPGDGPDGLARALRLVASPEHAAMSHAIVVYDRPYDEATVEAVAHLLDRWQSASIAFAYPSREAMLAAEPSVEAWKQRTANRINFLFPDVEHGRAWSVSQQKIVDNAVCDTVRVKYLPVQRDARSPAGAEVEAFFAKASDLYRREHMYLRAPTDGYLAARAGDGFFITATLTNKVSLDPRRISFVHGYDRATNVLTYSGPFLPSSDSVEAAIVLARHPEIDFLVHTHASRLFTRNPSFRQRVRVPPMAYGEPALGDALCDALSEAGDGFVIMAEHGEVFAGSGEADVFLGAVAAWCKEARLGLVAA